MPFSTKSITQDCSNCQKNAYLCKNRIDMILEINKKRVTPIEYAKGVTATELKNLVKVIKKSEYEEYNDRCRVCFEHFLAGEMEQAAWWSNHAESLRKE